MAKQAKTTELNKLVEAMKAASHEERQARAAAEAAQGEVAQRRDAAARAHADGGDVDAALTRYHEAEKTFDEARIRLEGMALRAERARAATANYKREHHLGLLEDLEPAKEKAIAKRLDLATEMVENEAEINSIRAQASELVTASGHSPHGNVPAPDALSELMPVIQDIASGLRPIASPLPDWKHRRAVEQHHRDQAELAARREEDQSNRAAA